MESLPLEPYQLARRSILSALSRGLEEVIELRRVEGRERPRPEQEMVGQVSVKSESSWEILDCTVDLFLNALQGFWLQYRRLPVFNPGHMLCKQANGGYGNGTYGNYRA